MLQINDKYRIKSIDKHNVIFETFRYVQPLQKEAEGSYKWVNNGLYYPTVQSCTLGIMDAEAKDIISNDDMTLRELLHELDKIRTEILKATKDIKVVEVD